MSAGHAMTLAHLLALRGGALMRVNGYATADMQHALRRAIRPEATHGDLLNFRAALLALDQEVTGGKLPGLVSWCPCPNGRMPEGKEGEHVVFLMESPDSSFLRREVYEWEMGGWFDYSGDGPRDGWSPRAYLPLRVEDALPQCEVDPRPPAATLPNSEGRDKLPPGVEVVKFSPEDLKALRAAHRPPCLPCGHPTACDGLAGTNGDQTGCGWCADLADLGMLVDHLSRTYSHFTDGRISKPNTLPEEVFVIASDLETEAIEAAVREALRVAEQKKDGAARRCESGLPAAPMERQPPCYACPLCGWEGFNPDTICPECLQAREPRRVEEALLAKPPFEIRPGSEQQEEEPARRCESGLGEFCRCPLCARYMQEGR